ncbi:MAG: hypothetical protein H6867_07375 [Rhodospirillales bacterium]|nr:hypothetical protein [Rhodospirillales bacterium]
MMLPQGVLALDETDFWAAVRTQWGTYTAPDGITVIREDVTCDGEPDYIASRTNLDDPDGTWFELLVVTTQGGRPHSEPIGIPYGMEADVALCGTPGETLAPLVRVERWDTASLIETFGDQDTLCPAAITVDDHLCDKISFFWLPDSAEGQARFAMHRN